MPSRKPDGVGCRVVTFGTAMFLAVFVLAEPTAAQTEQSIPSAPLDPPRASSRAVPVELDGDRLWIGDGDARRGIDLGCEAAQLVVLDELAYARCPPNRVVRARIVAPFSPATEFLVVGMREMQIADGRLHVVRRDGSLVPLARAARSRPSLPELSLDLWRDRPGQAAHRDDPGQAAPRDERVHRELFWAGGILGIVGALTVFGGAVGHVVSNFCISILGGSCSSSGASDAVIGVWAAGGAAAGIGLLLVVAGVIAAVQPVDEARQDIAIDVEVGHDGLAMTLRAAF